MIRTSFAVIHKCLIKGTFLIKTIKFEKLHTKQGSYVTSNNQNQIHWVNLIEMCWLASEMKHANRPMDGQTRRVTWCTLYNEHDTACPDPHINDGHYIFPHHTYSGCTQWLNWFVSLTNLLNCLGCVAPDDSMNCLLLWVGKDEKGSCRSLF